MSNRHKPTARKSSDNFFRLKPLVAGVRIVVAGGFVIGAGVSPAKAELPVPLQGLATSLPIPLPVPSANVTLTTSPQDITDNANHGRAQAMVNGKVMTIQQLTDKATVDWSSFNIDKGYSVNVNQLSSSSVLLNNIHQNDASQILGSLTANGQIYLYNQNGFVFGKDSVVNTNSFMASTLKITDEAFNRGITQVFDENGRAALGIDGVTLDPKTVKILIEAGAKIHTDKAGRIIIAAPTIENKGSLSTEEQGQVILAASQDKVYLQAADKNSPFAGLVVEVETGGNVSNMGEILTRQGNATLVGFAVNQRGRITATSSVNINGSIRLLAQEHHGSVSGKLVADQTTRAVDKNDGLKTEAKLTFHSGSVTQIVADSDGATAIDEQKQPQSYLEANAHTVETQANSAIVAPGGKVNITATDKLADPTQGSKGRIYIDKNALIDVSGTKGVAVAMERNVGTVSAQSFELRNSPLQQSGVLKGKTIRVDLRKNTKIIDTSGAASRITRGIGERLGKGGEINLTSSSDVIINDSAKIDISGGSVDYQDGYISTTKLLTDYGRIVDISAADPNEHYAAIYGVVTEYHKKWDQKSEWNILGDSGQGQFEKGYREGKAAGFINIKAPNLVWNGELSAGSDSGPYQRQPGDRPDGGSFVFDSTAFASAFQDVRFQTEKNNLVIGLEDQFPKTANNKPQPLVLSTGLTNQSGVQHVMVKTKGQASVVAGTDVSMVPGGEFSLQATRIDVQGRIHAAGGSINLTIADPSGTLNLNEAPAGEVNLGEASALDVSGRWINDLQQSSAETPLDSLYIDGGSIKVRAVGDLYLRSGAKLRADGGARLTQNGKITAGKGGKIELSAVGQGEASAVHLNGQVSAASLSKGGSLTLSSGEIIVGNAPSKTADPLTLAIVNGQFVFDPESGFGAINLVGNFGGLRVGSDANLDLRAKNLVLSGNFRDKATDSSIRDFTHAELLPEHLRQPFQLSLTGNTDVTLETNSSITLDKGSTVDLAVTTGSIFIDGTINAPASKINLAINPVAGLEYDATQAVWFGQHARLLVAGDTRMNPVDALGRRSGSVLDGGNVSINAKRGYVVLEKGSIIDVSGTHATLDIAQSATSRIGANYVATDIGSNAGKIAITAAEGVVMDGEMRGFAGAVTAKAGTLALSLDRSLRNPPQEPNPNNPFPNGALVINVVQPGQLMVGSSTHFGDVIPNNLNGVMTVSADKVMSGGFSDISLTTPDQVTFLGDVSLKTAARIDIDAKTISWQGLNGATTGTVGLESAYLRVGSSLVREINDQPVLGGGTFNAHAQWTELHGASLWNGFNTITLDSAHDLRTVGLRTGSQRDFLGTMVTAANLNLHASQIYPSTLSSFTFSSTAQINISGTNTDTSPLSAAGSLTIRAPVINQGGVLKAPLGTISLIAGSSLTLGKDSLTSVSAAGQVIPFGVIQGGMDWLYPLQDPLNLVFDRPPEKQLVLNAPEVNLEKGSRIDIAGGGDLFGYEFKPVTDDFPDYLKPGSASYEGGFAILPSLGSAIAPYDHFHSKDWNYAAGSQVYLSGTDNLPAGYYTILPAHYALLPGAFLVTPQANSQDSAVTRYTKDGLPIVSGYQMLAGTSIRDARSSAFRIESSSDVLRKHAQYDLYGANSFYAQKALKNETNAPLLPVDSGQISIIAQTKLLLDGTINLAATGGRGARMDIAANNINVVNSLSSTPVNGTLEILDSDLNNLKVDSLLLGGARKRNANGSTDVSVTSNTVSFGSGTQLQVTDLVAAETEKVEVKSGATLEAKGSVNTGDSTFNIVGDGALLRLSADHQITLNRTSAPGAQGELVVANGATLRASKSMLLDASKSTSLEGDILMHGGSLNLSANTINLGDVAGLSGSNALNLTNQKLMNLSVDELVLNSRGMVGFYGNVGQIDGNSNPINGDDGLQAPITFDRLVVNAAGFSGFGSNGQTARLRANNLVLANPMNVTAATGGTGQGHLDVLATNFTQGAGTFGINGFNTANISVKNGFYVDGKSVLNVASDLNLNSAYLTAVGGSSFKLDASGHALHVGGNGNAVGAVSPGFGAAMEFIADTVAFDANALLPSGKLNLHALIGDVAVASIANIDLAGRAVAFADAVDYTPGGTFSAIADNGAVTLASGSKLNLSTGGGSAAGGSLLLKAPKQTVTLAGQIKAIGGSAEFDVSTFSALSNFDSLMAVLKNAGVSDSINFRSRDADIVQAATTSINANTLTLVADKGNINLFGQLHTYSEGSIELYAGDKITLENGSQLFAMGYNKGGKVLLSSVDGDNDGVSGITLKSGSLIDVRAQRSHTSPDFPTYDLGPKAKDGTVTLRALRTVDGINIDQVDGTIKTANPVYAVGVKKYSNADLGNDGQIDSADIAKIKADNDSYMTVANINNVGALGGQHLTLTPGVQIDYTGDLALKSTWDLVDWRYNGNPGHLAIRTTGNLQVDQSLTDGFKTVDFSYQEAGVTKSVTIIDKLQSGESWSYSLAAGSDLSSADTNRVSSPGNLVVGSNVKVRTGTGDMRISAGGDINISAAAASVAKKPSIDVPANAQSMRISNSSGWKEGAYLSGPAAIVSGTTISKIDTTGIGEKKTTGATAISSSVLKLVDTAGWVVGDTVSGTGIATNSTIIAINVAAKTVTLSKPTNAAIASGVAIQNNAAVVNLSNKVTAAISKTTATAITANYANGTIYSAGQASSNQPYGSLTDYAVAKFFYSEYPVNGGELALSAGGNINGAVSGNDFNDWLMRIGSWTGSSGQPTAWGVALGYLSSSTTNPTKSTKPLFQQNIGSFGGGNVTVKAAGDIANLEVVMPTTAKPIGSNTADNLSGFTSNDFEVNGGGDMTVRAGGDVVGGSYYLGKGTGSFSAGGEVKDSTKLANGPVFYSGDTRIDISAVKGVKLSGVFDPMIFHNKEVNFFSYTDASSVAVKSLAGNVTLAADNGVLADKYKPNPSQSSLAEIYPASLQASAFGGNVVLSDDIVMFPSAKGQLNVFAQQDITAGTTGGAVFKLGMSDADRTLKDIPSAYLPLARNTLDKASTRINPYGLPSLVHAPVPVHTADGQPARFVTSSGDIKDISLNTPKKTVVKAGRDINNLTLAVQNLKQDDVSIIEAGRDIVYPSNRDPLTGGLISSSAKMEVAGPGDVLVKTGRDMDLGTSDGLATVGTTYNSGLGDKGSNITVLAGLNGAVPDYVRFLNSYKGQAIYEDKLQSARNVITEFMRQHTGNGVLGEDSALLAFAALPSGDSLPVQSKLNSLLLPVMFNEIKLAGTASAGDKSKGNEGGYAAIEALFPGNNWQGDLNLFFSKLQTLKGGDINMLVPGGQINAGLSVAFTGAKDATELGIVAQRQGAINAVLRDDFLVNKSRVFSLDGSDIMIWSSEGDIDAGKGAKSAISAPAPNVYTDKDGNLVVEFPPVVSGSGIRTAASSQGMQPGDVYLFAPKGVIDAGEAGIGGTNVTISATAVLGANNIQVGGVGTGVPVAASGSVAAGLTGTSNMTAGVSQMAESSVSASPDKDKSAAMKNAVLGMLSVEVLGFGE